MQSFLAAFLARLIVPPLLPPLDLPISARLLPPVRVAIEEVCKSFFWIGASQGWWLGLIVGLIAGYTIATVHQYLRWIATAIVRLINSRLPPHRRDSPQ